MLSPSLGLCPGHQLVHRKPPVPVQGCPQGRVVGRSMTTFVLVSPDLHRCVLDTRAKRGAELFTDRQLADAVVDTEGQDAPGLSYRRSHME